MIELLPVSIGIGLGVSLLLSEIFGLTAGGLVVPGYIALHLSEPLTVLLTLGAGIVTYILIQALSSVMIIYGRRRIVLLILAGYLIGAAIRTFAEGSMKVEGMEFSVVGFIIPGLIAIWIDRRGMVESLCSLITVSVIVRLILVLLFGVELKS
jgi:poly-gamma-glutamate biosynthesis protein PgsC/CapC